MIRLRTPFLAATLFASVAGVGFTPAFAQSTPAPANSGAEQTATHHHATERMLPGQLADGRIAFLKAELKITPPRETLWQQVAVAIHENANALDQVITAAWQSRGAMHAIQRIERRQQFARVRADNDARLLAARLRCSKGAAGSPPAAIPNALSRHSSDPGPAAPSLDMRSLRSDGTDILSAAILGVIVVISGVVIAGTDCGLGGRIRPAACLGRA